MSEKERVDFGEQMKGKVIELVQWVEEGGEHTPSGYWVITFTDGGEVCFNLTMTELVRPS